MVGFIESLENAQTLDDRAQVIRERVSPYFSRIENMTGGKVIDTLQHEGFHVGEKVEIDCVAGPRVGYVGYFLQPKDSDQIRLYIIPETGIGGYAGHLGQENPRKLE